MTWSVCTWHLQILRMKLRVVQWLTNNIYIYKEERKTYLNIQSKTWTSNNDWKGYKRENEKILAKGARVQAFNILNQIIFLFKL